LLRIISEYSEDKKGVKVKPDLIKIQRIKSKKVLIGENDDKLHLKKSNKIERIVQEWTWNDGNLIYTDYQQKPPKLNETISKGSDLYTLFENVINRR
jgi:hypothetical protein